VARNGNLTHAVGQRNLQLLLVLGTGAAFIAGILLKVSSLYTVWYWQWPPRDLDLLRTALLLALPLLPFGLALYRIERGANAVWPTLALLLLAMFAWQVLGAICQPRGLDYIRAVVVSPMATSYFTDALNVGDVRTWLANFHTATGLAMHSLTKPPGPILYYRFAIGLFGPEAGAVIGGLTLGALAAVGAAVFYFFQGVWTDDRKTRLLGCALYSLVPASTVFFPGFDQIYALFTMLAVIAWHRALDGSVAHALALGVLLAVGMFFAYQLVLVGVFLLLQGIYRLACTKVEVRSFAVVAAVALSTYAALYVVLWATTGFHPWLSLVHALDTQQAIAAVLDRPWWACVLHDPYDFLFGSGILVIPLLILFAARITAQFDWHRPDLVLPLLGLATILIVDVSGLVRAETARVWMFMQPFALAPAAGELSRFDWRGRTLIYALQWLVLVVMVGRLSFINV
jgi:hypothetical protein